MLESGGVGGVTGDGNANVLQSHDSNALGNVVSTVATNGSTGTVRICGLVNNAYFLGSVVKLSLYVGKAVDTGNDHSGILAETVKDNAKRLVTNLVSVKSDLDSTLCCCEGLVTCKEAEALSLIGKKHCAKVTVAETNLTVLSNGAGDTEGLKTDTDSSCCLGCLLATLLKSDGGAYSVSPDSVLKADRLGLANDLITVDTCCKSNFLAFLDGGDAIFSENGVDLINSSLITFK